jgi:hypothetical protein
VEANQAWVANCVTWRGVSPITLELTESLALGGKSGILIPLKRVTRGRTRTDFYRPTFDMTPIVAIEKGAILSAMTQSGRAQYGDSRIIGTS